MAAILFKNANEITKDWLFYIENEAQYIAQGDEFSIRNFMERELFNPELSEILDSEEFDNLFEEDFDFGDYQPKNLNFTETNRSFRIAEKRKKRFKWLLEKVRLIFC